MAPSQVLNAMTPIGSQANSETPAPDRTPRRVDEFSIPLRRKQAARLRVKTKHSDTGSRIDEARAGPRALSARALRPRTQQIERAKSHSVASGSDQAMAG